MFKFVNRLGFFCQDNHNSFLLVFLVLYHCQVNILKAQLSCSVAAYHMQDKVQYINLAFTLAGVHLSLFYSQFVYICYQHTVFPLCPLVHQVKKVASIILSLAVLLAVHFHTDPQATNRKMSVYFQTSSFLLGPSYNLSAKSFGD